MASGIRLCTLMVTVSAGRELSQAGETGVVACIVGAVVIDENGQGPEGWSTDFWIEEHLQVADRRMINPYLGGRQILALCRFTEQLCRLSLTETHKMECVCHTGCVRCGGRQVGRLRYRSPHGPLARRDLRLQLRV